MEVYLCKMVSFGALKYDFFIIFLFLEWGEEKGKGINVCADLQCLPSYYCENESRPYFFSLNIAVPIRRLCSQKDVFITSLKSFSIIC